MLRLTGRLSGRTVPSFSLPGHTFLPPAVAATGQTLVQPFAERQGEQGPHAFMKELVQACFALWLARRLQSGPSPGRATATP